MIAIPVLLIAQALALLAALYYIFKLDVQAWNSFLNSKLPLIWTQVTVPLLIMYCIDWLTDGKTIRTLLNINEDSKDAKLYASAIFLVGIFWGVVWACKGGF